MRGGFDVGVVAVCVCVCVCVSYSVGTVELNKIHSLTCREDSLFGGSSLQFQFYAAEN